jgi:hypothetical protein
MLQQVTIKLFKSENVKLFYCQLMYFIGTLVIGIQRKPGSNLSAATSV